MFKITDYMKAYKKESIIAPLFKMLEACFELLVPKVMADIVDYGIAAGNTTYIYERCGILLLLAFIGLSCSVTAQYFAAKAAMGVGKNLRNDLFSHINTLSYSELDEVGTATLITRMTNDINQMQSGVNMFLRLFLRSPFVVFGAMIMAFTVDVKAALIFVVTIPLLSIVVFGIMLYSIPLYKKVQKSLDKVLLLTRENLTGARVIRAFNRQDEEIDAYKESGMFLYDAQIFVGKISALMNPATYIIVNAAIIVLLYVGAVRVDNGLLTQGQVIALVNYMNQILVELVKLANLIILLTKSTACAKRVGEVFEMSTSVKESEEVKLGEGNKAGGSLGDIEFKNVSFTFKDGSEPALKDISFTAKAGETIGVIGGTGSGKSTLVNLIPRFYDATQGEILVGGINVKEYGFDNLRGNIGIVPQKAVLFNGTIRDNIRWGNENATDEEIMEAVRTAQAEDVVAGKKDGLLENVLQGGKNFSGGQRQRLTIARALVRKPQILILDDSASALDFATDLKLRKAIAECSDNMTVFLVSQRASTVKNADKIIVLEDGEVAGIGTHEELLANCELYSDIVKSQEEE